MFFLCLARDARRQEMTNKTNSRCDCETRQSAQVPLGGLVEWKTHETRLDSKLGICGTVQGFFCLILRVAPSARNVLAAKSEEKRMISQAILRAADDCSLFICFLHITAALE